MRKLIYLSLLLAVLSISAFAQGSRGGGRIVIDSTGAIAVTPKSTRGATVSGKLNTCLDVGANDTYACSLTPALASYITGQVVYFKANTANTGAATLNLNSLGAKTIKKVAGGITTDLATDDIRAGQYVAVQYDGTNFQMLSASGNADAGGSVTSVSGTANQIDVATGTTTPALSISSTLAIPGTSTHAGKATFSADPADTTNTNASVVVNPATSAANEFLLGVLNNGSNRFTVDAEGDTATAGNSTVTGTLGVTGASTLGVVGTGALSSTTGAFSSTVGVTGVTTATGGVSVGSGNGTLLRLVTGTASLDFTALAANACETLTIAVTNSTTGGSVSLGLPDALADVDGATESTLFTGWVSADGTVSVRRCNVTGTVTADPAAATVRATVLVF